MILYVIMKRLFIVILACLAVISCNSNKRIVSDTPVKSEVLGIELCTKMSMSEIENALIEHTEKFFFTTSERVNNHRVYRSMPLGLNFLYGNMGWTYCDVIVTDDDEVVTIKLVSSYENLDDAEKQYKIAVELFTNKYGKANVSDDNKLSFWTDDINTVGVQYDNSSAINGNDRSFCELYYVNIALSDKAEKEIELDI